MKSWSLPAAAAVAVVLLVSATDLPAATAIVEHTFVVSQVNLTHLCKDTLVAGHRGERAAPGAGDRGDGGRLGGGSCCQQVTLQHYDPLVIN
ncbi:hypothetical protein EJB05_23910, partial [Eragrostis curvula]